MKLVGFSKVFLGLLDIGLDGFLAWSPASWADFSMFVSELEGLDKTEGFFNGTADWEVIDGDLAENAGLVDDEKTTEKKLKSKWSFTM